jgi:hypothetical protein
VPANAFRRDGEPAADIAPHPELWPQERLFFEPYGHALQRRPHRRTHGAFLVGRHRGGKAVARVGRKQPLGTRSADAAGASFEVEFPQEERWLSRFARS